MKKMLYLAAALLMAACSAPNRQQGERTITVTIEPIRYFTEQIAGDKFKVVSMVPGGSNPETYDPTPQQLMQLANSEAYLRIGYIGFEQIWMDRLTENAPQMKCFDLSQGIALIRDESHQYGGGNNHGVEPHIWNTPCNARIIVHHIYTALCQLDPDNKAYYTENLEKLNSEINETDNVLRTYTRGTKKRVFLIYHPALSYFARDYDLVQICIEENGKEPSAAHLEELVNECRERDVRIVFIQKEFDSRNAELIANEIGAKVVPINPLNYNWKEELFQTAKALYDE